MWVGWKNLAWSQKEKLRHMFSVTGFTDKLRKHGNGNIFWTTQMQKTLQANKKEVFIMKTCLNMPRICESLELAASVKKTELSLTSGLYSAIIRLSNLTRGKCSAWITSAFQWANGKQPFKPVSWWTTRSVLRVDYDLTSVTAMQHFSTLFTIQGRDNMHDCLCLFMIQFLQAARSALQRVPQHTN